MSENIGSIYWNVDADTTGAISSEKALAAQTVKVEKQLKSLDTTTTKTTKAVNKGMASMGRGAGQAGIQMQQFIGQVQGGQSVMLALSQQSADLGFVLGAPLLGAIVGITASLAGMMIPSLMNTKTSLELVEKATENVKAALTLSIDGVANYSDEMKKLKVISESLVKVKLANLIAEQSEALKIAQKGISKSVDDMRGSFDTYSDVVEKLYKDYTPKTERAMRDLNSAISAVGRSASDSNLENLEKALTQSTEAGINQTKAGRELASQLVELISEYKSGTKTIEEIKKALADSNVVLEESTGSTLDNKNAIDAMVASLREQAKQIGETERQTAIRIATEKGATAEQLKAINLSYDRIEAEEERIKKVKELEKEEAEAAKNAEKRAAKEEKEFLAKIKRNGKQWQKKNEERQGGLKFAKETMQPEGENDAITQLQEEHAKLLELKAKFVEDSLVYDEALTKNEKAQADERLQYNVQTAALVSSSMSGLFGSIADMMAASGDEQSTAYKAAFALAKGFAVASAGLHLSSAIVTALDDPTAITTAQKFANVAAVATAGAGFVSAVTSATYSGREHGGSVNAGQTYEVGEKNKPEMLMIPGNNGKVFSNAEMKGMMGGNSGGNPAPIINNYGAANGVSVEHKRNALTQQDMFNIVYSENTNPNSRSRRAQTGSTNIKSQLGGRRRS